MALNTSPEHIDIQTSDNFDEFLMKVQEGKKGEVASFLSRLIGSEGTEAELRGDDSSKDLSKKLGDALQENDVVKVWRLIAEASENETSKTLAALNEVCKDVAEKEKKKEGCCKFFCARLCTTLKDSISWILSCNGDDIDEETEMRSENEQAWIKILSNPLYISLEWLWRNNLEAQQDKESRSSEKNTTDVIEAALHDAYLLEKIASYEHHYSRDEYENRAKEYEKFAADIVEQTSASDSAQLHEIMDINGNGCLLTKKHENVNESLSLLKMAADKQRKSFVASPKCQYVLNEIVYRGWPKWQDKGLVVKTLRFLFHLVFVTFLGVIFYLPVRLVRRGFNIKDESCWNLRKLYELPYSKFINHTMSYVVFLCLVFASTFQSEFGTTKTGLVTIDYAVLAFVVGLFLQEAMEAYRQGLSNYFSKWWNVIDTLIVLTFLLAYIVWLSAWGFYGKWKPREDAFIVADTIYASATVMAYFHLAHIFQVNSVLGPLQLSLYRMLKDVLKFLAIFLLLYIAFATGVAKIYSYYVASQIELQRQDNSHYQSSHPYGKHTYTFIGMFWLLLGLVEEDKIEVDDPAFNLTSTFGRIFMIAHVICTVIVALNMLIAMMNNSFDRVMENAMVEWKFSRTQMWLEWIDKGNSVPVPFNTVYYFLYCFFPNLWKPYCCCCKKDEENPNVGKKKNGQGNPAYGEEKEDQGKPDEGKEKKDRIEVMKGLVVEYLKVRYKDKWQELTAQKSRVDQKPLAASTS